MTKDEIRTFVAGLVDHRVAELEERVAVLERQLAVIESTLQDARSPQAQLHEDAWR
jgi:uncharacterized coiled-coil protein SlyX